ncbi:MAG: ATP-binding cassette domain-containing protein, partial [Aggregatilineales bacterium]
RFAVGMGAVFKKRLLYGTLQLDPEEIRHQGMGQFLGRVMESEAIEQLALSGGLMSILTIIQLVIALGVLANGAGGLLHAGLLFMWMLVTSLISVRYVLRNRRWIIVHRDLTNDLVERMVGHRTRLAQEHPERWHDMEDDLMSRYLNVTLKNDYASVQLTSILERGWLIIGILGIIETFVRGNATQSEIAVSVGGVLLASQALSSLSNGITSFASAINVWDQIAPLFRAATREKIVSHPSILSGVFGTTHNNDNTPKNSNHNGNGVAVLQARDLIFRYSQHGRSILNEANLTVYEGDKILLEGPSGGGKSTLAALMTALRRPDAGVLLLGGFDLQTLGRDEWRRRVVAVPQFHENHVLTETFAFNLLMGSQWPPPPELVQEALDICDELGLMPLLERMPSGTQQMVGESGWQLSHGERSRLYIARALLQNSKFIVLDESFGALDPETRRMALETVLKRAPTLLVIAHP